MKERPILFSGPMVRAILEGRKSQTRRVVKPQPSEGWNPVVGMYAPTLVDRNGGTYPGDDVYGASDENEGRICPYGVPGDRLWVRETWTSGYQDGAWGTICRADSAFLYGKRKHEEGPHFHAKEIGPHIRWRPSIFMPRWASRITLEITDVRVQRLQETSDDDAQCEGVQLLKTNCEGECGSTPCSITRQPFINLWDSINGKTHPWASNPWLWCLTFKRV